MCEYKIEYIDKKFDLEATFNEFGEDNWEVIIYEEGWGRRAIFKRRKMFGFDEV